MNDSEKAAFGVGLLAPILFAPVMAVVVLPAYFLRAWAAMTLWSWFAPWPFPFGLVAFVGLMLAWSVVFARGATHKDDRDGLEKVTDYAIVNLLGPLCALALGWFLRFWV